LSVYLAIDTATDTGSVAVGLPGAIAAEVLIGRRLHASALIPAIQEVLRLAGVAREEIHGILIADGPGSFTGLRIGFATVQGLVRERPDLSVLMAPSLLSTACLASRLADGEVGALYDALRGEVFAAVYRFGSGRVETLLAPGLTTLATLRESRFEPSIVVGDGGAAYRDQVREWTGREAIAPPAGGPRAAGLIELLSMARGLRVIDDVTAWEPDYGRLPEAQVRWEKTHGTKLSHPVSDDR
jgi:tRNA threonylcarbamoyladenosine biosynthesis protein TsaB